MSGAPAGAGLALAAAAALNASFLLQHRGSAGLAPVDAARPVATLRMLLRARVWVLGAVLGFTGWGLHIAAMRLAPLSVVQAFVAGGLALSVPLAAAILRRRLARAERQAIVLMAIALPVLALGLRRTEPHGAPSAALGVLIGGLVLAAALVVRAARGRGRPLGLGVAGGLLYAGADLALKALTGLHDWGAVATSPWLAVAIGCSVAAFFAFQAGLQADRPVAVITLMTAATNLASIGGAFAVFDDPLGRTPQLAALHAAAIVLVIAAACRLAPAQSRLA